MWRKSVYVIMWEGPYYREPSTATVKVPELSPSGLRPKLPIWTLALYASGQTSDLPSWGLGTGPPVFPVSPGLRYQKQNTARQIAAIANLDASVSKRMRLCGSKCASTLAPQKDFLIQLKAFSAVSVHTNGGPLAVCLCLRFWVLSMQAV
jgi:hypothetical protein